MYIYIYIFIYIYIKAILYINTITYNISYGMPYISIKLACYLTGALHRHRKHTNYITLYCRTMHSTRRIPRWPEVLSATMIDNRLTQRELQR